MKTLTCVVVGGGYAGVNAIKALLKTLPGEAGKPGLRIILLDKNDYHLRKVLLFRPAAAEENIAITFASMFPAGVELVQGTATQVEAARKKLHYRDAEGQDSEIDYDLLVLASGSVVRQPAPEQGGLALTGVKAAEAIREAWRANLRKAAEEKNASERQRLMTVAIAGAGISGIETSAELAHRIREDATALGLDPGAVRIGLYNSHKRLFQEGPAKVGRKLEQTLASKGVTVRHGVMVLSEQAGTLTLSDGRRETVGLCIWTLGLMPAPGLGELGVPLSTDGYIVVDGSYRVQGLEGVYSIGDCARIIDPATGHVDGKTCKEATGQAARIAKIIAADLAGRPAPAHKSYMDVFCFGLGPEQGMVWTRQWGLDIVLTGKLGWKVRKMTWDIPSFIK